MLPKLIKQLRENHELSQAFVADELGMSRPTYAQVEQGGRELTISEMKKLAQLFNTPVRYFVEEESPEYIINITSSKKEIKTQKTDLRISIPQEKLDKFKQLLIYILKKVGGKPNVGMTVIYKLFYFIDFDYYEKYEEQLLGLKYIKNHHGPTPVVFKKIIDEMIKNNELEIIKSNFYQYPQAKYLINPNLEPDLTIFSGQEIEHVDWELNQRSDYTANYLSELSHKDVPWVGAKEGDFLDYEAVFYRTHETSVRLYDNEGS